MKNQFKTFLVILVFTAFIAIVVAIWYPRRKSVTYKIATRPEDFPKILVAPESAEVILPRLSKPG